jgi:predicted negative regulator of RcsB-dependent stress response
MARKKTEDTLNEILEEDVKVNGKQKRGRGCLLRLLILLVLAIVLFMGFIITQQYLLDLEAEAIVSAARTATALQREGIGTPEPQTETMENTIPISEDAELMQSLATHTVIVSAQQTSVAEFQLTTTPEE